MPVTLLTGGLGGLIYFVLSLRVVLVRLKAGVLLGDGGNEELLGRIRAHANFAEYVPLCLVLIGAIELSYDGTPLALWAAGLGLLAVRVAHAVGLGLPAPNGWRAGGITGTWVVLVGLSLWALYLFAVP